MEKFVIRKEADNKSSVKEKRIELDNLATLRKVQVFPQQVRV